MDKTQSRSYIQTNPPNLDYGSHQMEQQCVRLGQSYRLKWSMPSMLPHDWTLDQYTLIQMCLNRCICLAQ